MNTPTRWCPRFGLTARSASVALFFVAGAGLASAAPTITAPFVQNGSSVTTPGASTPPSPYAGATFQDAANTYTVTISPASGQTATLDNTGVIVYVGTGSSITVSSGITLSVTGSSTLFVAGVGTVSNSGSIGETAAGGIGVYIGGMGTVTNTATGVITSSQGTGIYINANGTVTTSGTVYGGSTGIAIIGAGTVTNSGEIFGVNNLITPTAGTDGVDLLSGSVTNSGAGAGIEGYENGVEIGGAGTVTNAGGIIGIKNDGVEIEGTGTVTSSVVIVGGVNGIAITGAGTVNNSGEIYGVNNATTPTAGNDGVLLQDGGSVTNSGTGALIEGYLNGVEIDGIGHVNNSGGIVGNNDGIVITGAEGDTVTNSGVIEGTSVNGIVILGAGTVTNSDVIVGGVNGIAITGAGTVNNSGEIYGVNNVTTPTAGNDGVLLQDGGSVTNSGTGALIEGYLNGVEIDGAGTVTNTGGDILGSESGVYITGGGTVTTSGAIAGEVNGIVITGAEGDTVTNSGTVVGETENGIDVSGAGVVTNSGTGIVQGVVNGVDFVGAGTVNNSSKIYGVNNVTTPTAGNDGVLLQDGGSVTNSGTAALIFGYENGVEIDGAGTVTNTGGDILGSENGVYITGGGTVTTSGAIAGEVNGIVLTDGGMVNNTGTIYGETENGIDVSGAGVVTNSGKIYGENSTTAPTAGGDGVLLGSGSVSNTGTGAVIAGYQNGISITGTGSVNNAGGIAGEHNDGIFIGETGSVSNSGVIVAFNGGAIDIGLVNGGGGTVTNGATGYITGLSGIDIDDSSGTATVINSGSIIATAGTGIYTAGVGTVVLAGGTVSGADAVDVNGADLGAASTVTVVGRSGLTGQLVSSGVQGTLNLDLVGLTPAKAAQLAALNGSTGNTFVLGPNTYAWTNLKLVDSSVSLEQVVDPGLVNAAKAFDNATSTVGLPLSFDPVYVAAAGNPEAALNELVGREINQGLDSLGVNMATTFASDLDQHLDNLLTGNQVGGVDLGGIHVGEAGSAVAFTDTATHLSSLLRVADDVNILPMEMSTDTKAMVAAPPPPSWGVWASGNVTLGDESGPHSLSGFHSTLGSPTLGLDYRVCPNLLLGIVGSYTTGDANFDDGSNIGVNTELLALYGTWRSGNWHVNGIAGGGLNQFNDTRTTFGATANSSPRGYNILTDWTAGYDFHLGDRWVITPEAGLQYTHLGIDSFSESGAGAFDLNEGSQDIDSLRSHVGFKLDKAYSLGKDLTFIPELRAQWYHEFMDDSRGVSTSLPGAPALGSFSVNTFSPQRDFALVGAGLNTAFTGYNGVPVGLFLNYNCQVGQSDYISNSVNAGIRVDF